MRAQASKTLSTEGDLHSVAGRLKAAEAGARGSRFAASTLDELAELVFEALPPLSSPPPLPPPPPPLLSVSEASSREGVGISGGQDGGSGKDGGGSGGGRRREATLAGLVGLEATLAGLVGLEARLARVSSGGGGGGDAGGDGGEGQEAGAEDGGSGGEGTGTGWCFDGRGQLRTVVRAVRALAEAAARIATDRDRAASEVGAGGILATPRKEFVSDVGVGFGSFSVVGGTVGVGQGSCGTWVRHGVGD